MNTRIFLAEDHKIFREGLMALLRENSDFEVVGEADNGRTAVKLAKELLPNVVIMDIRMPDLNGFEATRQIMAEATGVRVIGLSMYSDSRSVREMLRAGAAGFVLKDDTFDELSHAIRRVLKNRMYLSSGMSDVVVKDYVQSLSATGWGKSPVMVLTPREREVLQLLAEGKTTREIGGLLYVSVKTVETHRKHIMDKLGLYRIAELTKYAIREGLTSLER